MKIKGLEGLTDHQVQLELDRGARFVTFDYCISILVLTFRRSSNIYFVRSGETALVPGLKYTFLTLIVGWWGIPWGPIYTIGSVAKNFAGGRDVTAELAPALQDARAEQGAAQGAAQGAT